MKKLRIAHFAEWGPHRCGMYHTVKDMILAERKAGMDSMFFNVTLDKEKKVVCPPRIHWDGDFSNAPIQLAGQADILVRHSIIPKEYKDMNKPMVMCLHGRPEYSFLLEHYGQRRVFMEELVCAKEGNYSQHLYFWPEFETYWKYLLPNANLTCVPAMCNTDEFTPDGKKFDLGEKSGTPNILIADIWREDVTPFNLIFAALRFQEKYAPKAKIHVIGQSTEPEHVRALFNVLKETGAIGHVHPVIQGVKQFYRAADMVITPHVIANRIVREAQSCGCPVVNGNDANYLAVDKFALEIYNKWMDIEHGHCTREKVRQQAIKDFGLDRAGKQLKEIYEKLHKSKVSFSKLFDETSKGTHVWPKRTICEVHRELYDTLVLNLAKDHPEILREIVPILEESYLMGIKLAKTLIVNKLNRPDNEDTDIEKAVEQRTQRVKLVEELKRQEEVLSKWT